MNHAKSPKGIPPESVHLWIGINLRGFSLSVIGRQYLAYAAVDSLSDANKVIEILKA
jgi:hypothetical protein